VPGYEEHPGASYSPIAEQREGWDDEGEAGFKMWSSETKIVWISLVLMK
jgi:hypothetical protein